MKPVVLYFQCSGIERRLHPPSGVHHERVVSEHVKWAGSHFKARIEWRAAWKDPAKTRFQEERRMGLGKFEIDQMGRDHRRGFRGQKSSWRVRKSEDTGTG